MDFGTCGGSWNSPPQILRDGCNENELYSIAVMKNEKEFMKETLLICTQLFFF